MMKKTYSKFYLKKQLGIDKTLIRFRFDTEQEFFNGENCLELGPADGVMTELLVSRFRNLHVVDGDLELLNVIPNFKNLKKFHSWFEDFEPPIKYDTIIMEHVLEHVFEPVIILKKISRWLNQNGVLIVGVPNAKSIHRLAAVKMGLLSSEYELNERDKSQGHLRVYDFDLLEKDINKTSLEIIARGGVFLKVLSNKQIEESWTPEMIHAFYEVGKIFQKNAADIFIVAKQIGK